MSTRRDVYAPKNAGWATANHTLFKVIGETGIHFRIVPTIREESLRRELESQGNSLVICRANSVRALEDYVEFEEESKVRPPEEDFEPREVWRPISSWPKMPRVDKVEDGRYLMHNGKVTMFESTCMGCGGPTRNVAYCYADRKTHPFCNSACVETYARYLRK